MRLLWSFVPLMAQPEYSWATGTTSPRCAISAFWGRLSHILARNPIGQKLLRVCTNQTLCGEIAGGIPKALICQPPLHRGMDEGTWRNPAATPKIHAKTLRPYFRRGLHLNYLRP